MVVPVTPASGPNSPSLPPAHGGGLYYLFEGLHEIRVRVLNIKVLFSATAIVYQGNKFIKAAVSAYQGTESSEDESLLMGEVYRIVKLLKKIWSFIDGDNSFAFLDLFYEQQARHTLLKLSTNSLSVISGVKDLLTDNEITRLAFKAIGLGYDYQLIPPGILNGVTTFLTPLPLLKMATKTSHVYLSAKKVWELDPQDKYEKKRDSWILLGKASLDFGIETTRWAVFFAGYTMATCVVISAILAFLGLVSNGIGLYKALTPAKENAKNTPAVLVVH